MRRSNLKLYLVTDRKVAGGRELKWIVKEAVRGGVTMVQLREKDCDTREFLELARELKTSLSPLGIPLIINDRIDIAQASGADGVHIGQSDMPYIEARRLLGPDKIIGLSVENFEQIEEANGLDVDYIGVSPVFETPTKTDTKGAFGLDGLRKAVQLSKHPAVAIGGINKTNVAEVFGTGCDGVAVVSAIVGANSPADAAEELLECIEGK